MSDVSDWRCWRLVRHILVEGIVLGFLHAHAAGGLISLQPVVGGRLLRDRKGDQRGGEWEPIKNFRKLKLRLSPKVHTQP